MNFFFSIKLIIVIVLYLIIMILFYIFISNNYVKMVYEDGEYNV